MRVVLIAALFAGFAAAQNPIAPLAQNAFGTIATIPNSSTGTTINKLASLTGGKAIITTAGATSGVIGIVIGGAGTAGSATVQTEASSVSCVFDGATTAGDYVQISASVNGDCTDAGATLPSSGQALGTVLSTNGGGGNYKMLLNASGAFVSSSGGGTPSGCSANQLPVAGASVGLPFTCPGATLTGGALVLSASGTASSLTFGNATSGTLTLQPVTGALGTVTASFPANTGTVLENNLAQTISGVTTFSSGPLVFPYGQSNTTLTAAYWSMYNAGFTVPRGGGFGFSPSAGGPNPNNWDVAFCSPSVNTVAISTQAGGCGNTSGSMSAYSVTLGSSLNAATMVLTGNALSVHDVAKANGPAITSGFGTSPSIAGGDESFVVTVGTGGVATTGAVTFAAAYTTNAPNFTCSAEDGTPTYTSSFATTGFTISGGTAALGVAWTASTKIHCVGRGFL